MMSRLTITALAFALGLATPLAAFERGAAGPYLAARQASLTSDYEAAVTFYTRALASDPDNMPLVDNALVAFIGAGQIDKAEDLAIRYQGETEGNQIADLVLKAVRVARGEFAISDTPIAEADGLGPLMDGLLTAWAYLGQGKMSEAITAFGAVAASPDFESFARYHQALALASVGDFEAADKIMSGAEYGPLQLSARGIEAHAQVLVQLERNQAAIDLLAMANRTVFSADLNEMAAKLEAGQNVPYDFVTSAAEGSAEVFFNLAAILNGRAAPEHVLIYARMAQHIRPDHIPALLTIAETLEDLSQYGLATKAFAEIPDDAPHYYVAEMGRADSLYAVGSKDAAAEVLRALSKSHGDIPIVHAALGDLLARLEKDDEALAAYDTSISLRDISERSAWRIFYARGIVHERMQDFPAMEADFRKALDLVPNQPEVLNYLGYSLVEQRIKLDEALGMIETAVQERPESGYITDSLGWVFYRLGRFEEAVAPMERAVELEPVDPIVNDHLGDVYWMVGRTREAEFQWKRAMSFDPKEDEAIRIRRKLEVGLDQVLEEEDTDGTGAQTTDDI